MNTYRLIPEVRTQLIIVACVLLPLVPVALYLFLKVRNIKLAFSDRGVEVSDFSWSSRFLEFADVDRLGIAYAFAGRGRPPNEVLLAKTRRGKELQIELYRYENRDEILRRFEQATGCSIESVDWGVTGNSWQEIGNSAG